jgi:hypothetical protein
VQNPQHDDLESLNGLLQVTLHIFKPGKTEHQRLPGELIQNSSVTYFSGNMAVYAILLSPVPQKALICIREATLCANMCTLFCGLKFM